MLSRFSRPPKLLSLFKLRSWISDFFGHDVINEIPSLLAIGDGH
jgi:hypothetical protein